MVRLSEEDIKVLEALIEEHKKLGDTSEETRISQPLFKIIIKALENLIKGYKELDKENTRQHELLGKIHEKYQRHYIPKSKVREKIEILEKHKQNIKPNTLDTAYKQAYCDGGIDSLNEIL